MGLPNLSGSNIQDTYQRVLHTDGTSIFDGTGSTVLSSTDLGSLQTMNNNTISEADWDYVESMDQHVNTTSSVYFAGIDANLFAIVGVLSSIAIMPFGFSIIFFEVSFKSFLSIQTPF